MQLTELFFLLFWTFFLYLQVKFNPGRADNMIIQSIALLDQMDKDINTFAMRVREWYSWHFPELKDIVKDNFLFAKCASYIKVNSSYNPPNCFFFIIERMVASIFSSK